MIIEQFIDKSLAHNSYAIISEGEMAVIDPGRDPNPYLTFAKKNNARIKAIIETHPHADFVSSHLELAEKTGANIYVSEHQDVEFDHRNFSEGDHLDLGKIKLRAIDTPGHSPDSISILVMDESDHYHALFSGDMLFVGDVGRPDLRDDGSHKDLTPESLAKQMYKTIQEKILELPDEILVYPAHGAGSLCGKTMGDANFTTLGAEKKDNWALQKMEEDEFVKKLTEDQPWNPAYFSYDVNINRKGAPALKETLSKITKIRPQDDINPQAKIIDIRTSKEFRNSHFPGSINIEMKENNKFETWLGTLVKPDDKYYLVSDKESQLKKAVKRAAKIGYDLNLEGVIAGIPAGESMKDLNVKQFDKNTEDFTILDVRQPNEVEKNKIFKDSINIPLSELPDDYKKIPTDKPVVVHCAAGFRSAAAASFLNSKLPREIEIYDLSSSIKNYIN